MKKALFFDMDGTLWDALVPLMESYNIAQEREGKRSASTFEMLSTIVSTLNNK